MVKHLSGVSLEGLTRGLFARARNEGKMAGELARNLGRREKLVPACETPKREAGTEYDGKARQRIPSSQQISKSGEHRVSLQGPLALPLARRLYERLAAVWRMKKWLMVMLRRPVLPHFGSQRISACPLNFVAWRGVLQWILLLYYIRRTSCLCTCFHSCDFSSSRVPHTHILLSTSLNFSKGIVG